MQSTDKPSSNPLKGRPLRTIEEAKRQDVIASRMRDRFAHSVANTMTERWRAEMVAPDSSLMRFLIKVKVNDAGCWVWTGGHGQDGYGRFFWDKPTGQIRAHQAVLRFLGVEVPDGMVPDHLCENTSCVNPAHLEIVTPEENTRRMWETRELPRRKNGHPFTPENTIYRNDTYGKPHRACRTCVREGKRRYEAKRKGQAA